MRSVAHGTLWLRGTQSAEVSYSNPRRNTLVAITNVTYN